MRKQGAGILLGLGLHSGMEANTFVPDALFDDVLKPSECTTTNKENVGGVDLNELLVRMLATALRRNRCNRAFKDLQQRLLHSFTGHIAGNRWVVALTRNLVDFVNVDNSGFGFFDVKVSSLNEFEQDVFNVFADISSLGQCGGVGNRKRNVQQAGKGLR